MGDGEAFGRMADSLFGSATTGFEISLSRRSTDTVAGAQDR